MPTTQLIDPIRDAAEYLVNSWLCLLEYHEEKNKDPAASFTEAKIRAVEGVIRKAIELCPPH